MSELLEPQAIATLVSNVTKTMCGTNFIPCDSRARGESLALQLVILPLLGERKINIVLAYDSRGSRALASALFSCATQELTRDMVHDAVRELLNMVAGQVVRYLQIDQPIGLPRVSTFAEIANEGGRPGAADAVLLRSEGTADLRLWIFEELPRAPPDPQNQHTLGARLRHLLRPFQSSPPDS